VHEIRRVAMDRQVDELQKKLKGLLTEAAEVSVALDRANGTIQGVPHYSVIELRAHDLGQQLSREIQQRHLTTMMAQQAPKAACPGCGAYCQLHPNERTVTSIDGPVPLPELRGHCPKCRRAFFPPQGDTRLRRPRTNTGLGS
jgi:hypothetical protein